MDFSPLPTEILYSLVVALLAQILYPVDLAPVRTKLGKKIVISSASFTGGTTTHVEEILFTRRFIRLPSCTGPIHVLFRINP